MKDALSVYPIRFHNDPILRTPKVTKRKEQETLYIYCTYN